MKRLETFAFCFVVWLLLTWSLGMAELIIGAAVALLVAAVVGDLFPDGPRHWYNPVRVFWALVYLPVFFWYVIEANLDVAYRIVHPERPIRPGIVKVQTALKSEVAKTFLANSITLTPGTLSVDIAGQTLYVHWINIRPDEAERERETARIVGRFEGMLRRIFE